MEKALQALQFNSDELKASIIAARQQLISLKSKISSYAGKPVDTTIPTFLSSLQEHLDKATTGPSAAYRNITLGQCVLAETTLSNFISDLQAQTAELTSLLAAIPPELNPADAVEKIVREVVTAKEQYEKRLLTAIDTVAKVHANAEALLSDSQEGGNSSPATQLPAGPRYVAREGCPGTLETEASPAEFHTWWESLLDWWAACWVGGSPPNKDLVSQIKLLISKEWRDRLEGKVNWASTSSEELRGRMEDLMLSTYPNLRRRVSLFNLIHQDRLRQGESLLQLVHRVEQAMKLGGVGSRTAFTLEYDTLTITLIVALLPQAFQSKLYERFQTYSFTINELKEWAGVCDTAAVPVHSRAAGKVAAIKAKGTKKKQDKPKPSRTCPNCDGKGHMARECTGPVRTCGHCGGSRHSAAGCWFNPGSPSYRPKLTPKKAPVNTVSAAAAAPEAEAENEL